MITPFDNTIREVMNLTWPMIVICVLLLSSIRLVDIFKNKKEFIFHKEMLMLIFIVYVLCLFQVVTFEDPAVMAHSNNLTPFKEILRYDIGSRLFLKNVIGNLVMFVPYGIFISIFAKLDSKWQALFLVMFASLTVEITQYSIGRVFDVDDIILNVSGGMIGYFIYYVISKIGDRAPKILRSNIALNLFTSVILGGMLYYIWRLFGLWINFIYLTKQMSS